MAELRIVCPPGTNLGTDMLQEIKQEMDIQTHKKLWNVAWDMWEQQNEALHNSDTNRELILETAVNNQIRQIYAIGLGQLTHTDFGLMTNSVDHQLQLPLQSKRLWVESIEAAIHRRQLHKHGTMVGEQRFMETWAIQNPPRQPMAPVHQ